jgi:twinkle protein
MSQFKETKLPCADCGSSDARAVYQSGVSICFSCGLIKAPGDEAKAKLPEGAIDFVFGETQAIRKRGLYLDTCRRYGYAVGNFNGKPVQIAPFYNERGQLVAQKLRTKTKDFVVTGNGKAMGLFGLQLARRGGKMIVITEGEIDAMSVSQAMGNTWPAVSLPSGSGSFAALKDSLEFLETYEKVILCFDNDDPGRRAT